jgi:Clp protease
VIYDEIGAFGIPAKAFLDELKALGPVVELTVRINSPGGSVFDGVAIYNVRRVGVDAVYTPAGADPVPVRVIARRPDTIVGFGETRIHAETATFELRASEAANPRPGDQLTVGGDTFVIQGEPERRDPDRLVWTLDVRST